MSESMTIVESTQYGKKPKTDHPINRVLKKHQDSKKLIIEILANDAGCVYNKKYNIVLDPSNRPIHQGQILEVFGLLSSGNTRCPVEKCAQPFPTNLILLHLQSDFMEGHSLPTSKVIQYFSQEFWNWRWYNGRFEKG